MQPSTRSPVRHVLAHRWSSVVLLAVLLVQIGIGLVLIRDLHNSHVEVQKIYDGSVHGLHMIGELEYDIQETRRATLYALTTTDGNLQVRYADQSREADRRVTEGILDNLHQAGTAEVRNAGMRLQRDWANYLAIRDEVLGLILESSTREAIDLDLSSGVPEFEKVHQDLDAIKRLYDRQASQRVAAVAEFSRLSTMKISAALVFGLLFGTVAIWAVQSIRMRSAVQLANLQMEFVASVSHELRTPVTAILSAGENIRDGLVHDAKCLREQGRIIATQAGHLSDLVSQVLLHAATGKDKPWHDVRVLRVTDVVESALADVTILLQESGITIEREIQAELPLVRGDLSVLSQCLQNLLVNAVKYSGASRSISISARSEATNNRFGVQISVRDYGVGIGDGDLAHIFEPFYRSSRAVASRIRGTGLGLSIAKRSAEAFGGKLTAVSTEGAGSVFTLHLPAVE